MELSTLAGNDALKRQLSRQAARRGLSHAYLIGGPSGSGKRTLARLLGAALVCEAGGEDAPCGRCPACKKALKGIHPDVIRVAGEDGKDLTVAQLRAMRSDAYIRPNEAGRKVYVVENAQAMNPSAQNAILKLLEEGPAYCAFLLLTDNPAAVLPTIRSRCEGVSLTPVSPREAEDYLLRTRPTADKQAVHAAALRCEGLIGRAVTELEGGGDDAPRESARTLVGLFAKGDELALAAFTVTLEKWDRSALTALMDEGVLLLRDALALQSGGGADADPQRRAVAEGAAALPKSGLMRAVTALEELRSAASFNVGGGHLCGALAARLAQCR